MSVSDPIADMLTKIRNAVEAKFEKVDVTTSKIKLEIVKILKNEGYIKNFKKHQEEGKNFIRIFLKYNDKMDPVIHGIERISTPGRRFYVGCRNMPRVFNGYGVLLISTSQGITTGKKALDKRMGGELICSIW